MLTVTGVVPAPHKAPPLVVLRIVPPAPPATQCRPSGHDTESRPLLVPEVWAAHVLPSVVAMIVPPEPTATQCAVSAHEIE